MQKQKERKNFFVHAKISFYITLKGTLAGCILMDASHKLCAKA
jgi:hypothetical protein